LIPPGSTKHVGRTPKIEKSIWGTKDPEIQHFFLRNTVVTVFILNVFLINLELKGGADPEDKKPGNNGKYVTSGN